MDKRIEKLLELRIKEKEIKEKIVELQEELLNDNDFEWFDEWWVSVKRVKKPKYSLSITLEELKNKYPDAVELKARNLADIRKFDRSVVDRKMSETIQINWIK